MWGLLITELGLLMIALTGMVLFNVDFKLAFPFRRIKINQLAGVVLMWLGTFLLVMLISIIIMYYFPEGIETAEELNSFEKQWPPLAAMLLVSVAPAICEEALHRGFLQFCVWSTMKNKWITCIIVGLFFGINHLDPLRFFSTAFMGGVMAYILIESDNFIYNMLFHFMNNFLIDVVSYVSNPEAAMESINSMSVSFQDILPLSIASYLIIGCVIPELILGGIMLLQGMRKLRTWGRTKIIVSIVIAVLISVMMLAAGMLMMLFLISSGDYDYILDSLNSGGMSFIIQSL
jgi:hypothetical protein